MTIIDRHGFPDIIIRLLLLTVFPVCFMLVIGMSYVNVYADNNSKQIIMEMQSKEIELYEQAVKLTSELRVTVIKSLSLEQISAHGVRLDKVNLIINDVLDVYGKMLLLRVVKTRQLKSSLSVKEAGEWIDLINFEPELLTSMSGEVTWAFPSERLGLSWEQKLKIMDILHRRQKATNDSNYMVNRNTILLKQELSKKTSDAANLNALVKAIIDSQRGMFAIYIELNYELFGTLNKEQLQELTKWAWSLAK
jgi:hypothetical protein